MISDDKRKHYETAANYLLSRREKGNPNEGKTYPLNRGDLMVLVVLLDQEMSTANPCVDPKRLSAIREKLGDLVAGAPEMSREEARPFRET